MLAAELPLGCRVRLGDRRKQPATIVKHDTECSISLYRADGANDRLSCGSVSTRHDPGDQEAALSVEATALACSRKANFWTFPVDVLGIGANTNFSGTL